VASRDSSYLTTEYHRTDAPGYTEQARTLIVLIPGHVTSGRIMLQSGHLGGVYAGTLPTLLELLLKRGNVLEINHAVHGPFSFEATAKYIVNHMWHLKFDRLVLIGQSMGARVATAIIDELTSRGLRSLIEGQNGLVIVESGPADITDIKQPVKYWWAWRWPRFVNVMGYHVFNRLNPGRYVELGAEELDRELQHYMQFFPNDGRRGQMRALHCLRPLVIQQYSGIRLTCIYSAIDALIRNSFVGKYMLAFGGGSQYETKTGWHVAHVEQPALWNGLLMTALDNSNFQAFTSGHQ
jgi:pimeloyl-ACP methyl ester carboxylesterase